MGEGRVKKRRAYGRIKCVGGERRGGDGRAGLENGKEDALDVIGIDMERLRPSWNFLVLAVDKFDSLILFLDGPGCFLPPTTTSHQQGK